MKILQHFDFDQRPSRSRYAAAARALVEDGVKAVELERGEDFPADVKMATVQSGVRAAVKKAGKTAQTYIVTDDRIIVGLKDENAKPRRGGSRRREPVAA
jgi:hypothetical protein